MSHPSVERRELLRLQRRERELEAEAARLREDRATVSRSLWDALAEVKRLRGALRHQCAELLRCDGICASWCEGCPCYEGGNCSVLTENKPCRDPENPCTEFVPGTPRGTSYDCDGDGHYMCRECVCWNGEAER
jgi:hypothetical protein